MKILLAVDGSDCSDAAAQELAKRPWPPQSEVKVITALDICWIEPTGRRTKLSACPLQRRC